MSRSPWPRAIKENTVGLLDSALCVGAPVGAWAEAVCSAEGASEASVVGESPAVGDVGDCFLAFGGAGEFTGGSFEAMGANPVGEGDARPGQDEVGVPFGNAVLVRLLRALFAATAEDDTRSREPLHKRTRTVIGTDQDRRSRERPRTLPATRSLTATSWRRMSIS